MKKTLVLSLACAFMLYSVSSMFAFGDTAKLVKDACSTCHSLERVCKKIGVADLSGWKKTTLDMIANGAPLSGMEADLIAAFMANEKPGSSSVCE